MGNMRWGSDIDEIAASLIAAMGGPVLIALGFARESVRERGDRKRRERERKIEPRGSIRPLPATSPQTLGYLVGGGQVGFH